MGRTVDKNALKHCKHRGPALGTHKDPQCGIQRNKCPLPCRSWGQSGSKRTADKGKK